MSVVQKRISGQLQLKVRFKHSSERLLDQNVGATVSDAILLGCHWRVNFHKVGYETVAPKWFNS